MRLLCIPLFFAVAVCPVDVGAHVEASDIVTTTGQYEVQGHLRVLERAHENDDDDRGIFDIDKINTLKLLEDAIRKFDLMIPKSSPPHGALATTITSLNTRKRKADQMLGIETKIPDIKTIVLNIQTKKADIPNKIDERQDATFSDKFLVEAIKELEDNAKKNEGEETMSFADIMYHYKDHSLYKVMWSANEKLEKNKWNALEVFFLYQLNFAKDELFKQSQLRYWVKFVDDCNKHSSSKKLLIDTLLKVYDMNSLLAATAKAPRTNRSAQRVENELLHLIYTNSKSPYDAFVLLKLDRAEDTLFASPEFNFWMKYTTYYNEQVHHEAKIKMWWVISKRLHWPLRDALKKIKSSKFTEELEEEVKTLQVDQWKAEDIAVDEVKKIVAAEMAENTDSVRTQALIKADYEYRAYKENSE